MFVHDKVEGTLKVHSVPVFLVYYFILFYFYLFLFSLFSPFFYFSLFGLYHLIAQK